MESVSFVSFFLKLKLYFKETIVTRWNLWPIYRWICASLCRSFINTSTRIWRIWSYGIQNLDIIDTLEKKKKERKKERKKPPTSVFIHKFNAINHSFIHKQIKIQNPNENNVAALWTGRGDDLQPSLLIRDKTSISGTHRHSSWSKYSPVEHVSTFLQRHAHVGLSQ